MLRVQDKQEREQHALETETTQMSAHPPCWLLMLSEAAALWVVDVLVGRALLWVKMTYLTRLKLLPAFLLRKPL